MKKFLTIAVLLASTATATYADTNISAGAGAEAGASAGASAGANNTNNFEGSFGLAGIGGGGGMCPSEGFTLGAPGVGGIGYNKTGNACLDWEIAQVLWKAGLISDHDFVDAALAISQTQERAATTTTTSTSTMSAPAPANADSLNIRASGLNYKLTGATLVSYQACETIQLESADGKAFAAIKPGCN